MGIFYNNSNVYIFTVLSHLVRQNRDDGKRRICRSADVATGKRWMSMRRTSAFYPSCLVTPLDQ